MNDAIIIKETKDILLQLIKTITKLSHDEYTKRIYLLSNSSIGEHTRHIIEIFQQLLEGYENGQINYEKRKRNIEIQQNINFAIECINNIIDLLDKDNKRLILFSEYTPESIDTNYQRELLYNLEHCIHHQAIIKITLLTMGKSAIEDTFGVAKSTVKYRSQCVH